MLTGKQELFAQGISKGLNITEAALEAGYAEKSAHVVGSNTLKIDKVQERVKELQEAQVDLLQQRFVGVAEKAMEELLSVLENPNTPPQTKTHTAKVLLDYAGFKPTDKHDIRGTGDIGIKVVWNDDNESGD